MGSAGKTVEQSEMGRRARMRRYIVAWVASAVTVMVIVAFVGGTGGRPAPPVLLLVALGVAMALAGRTQLSFRQVPGGAAEATTAIEVVAVPLMVLVPPLWAATVAGGALLTTEGLRTPGQYRKVAFNVASKVTAVTLGSGAFHAVSGTSFAGTPTDLAAAVLAGTIFVAVNSAAFAGVVAITSSRSWWTTIRDEMTSGLLLDVSIATVGVLAALLAVVEPFALPLLAAPALLDRLRARIRKDNYELVASKERAEAANRAKSQFLSAMSHELRTPLNAILGFGQLLESDDRLDDDVQEQAGFIVRAGRHLLTMIDELLEMSRIEAGQLDLTMEPVRVADVIAESLELVAPLGEANHVRCDVATHEPEVHVLADRQRLKQTLINLLSNAIKYNREGGLVTVSSARDGDTVTIEVADTGHGIAPDDVDRLFRPFERLETDRDRVQGTGLGLAISRSLVTAMGGQLTVASEPGTGSTFSIVLDYAVPPHQAGDDPRGAAPVPVEESPREAEIVHVEDNASNLELVRRIVSRRPGIRYTEVTEADAALAMVRERQPDLVLLDLQLAGTDGRTLLREMKADPALVAIPVAVLSADASPGRAEELRIAGAHAYLTKPFDVADLLALVDGLLSDPPSHGASTLT